MSDPTFFLFPNVSPSTDGRYLGRAETSSAYRSRGWDAVCSRADVLGAYVGAVIQTRSGTDGFLPGLVAQAERHGKQTCLETGGPLGTSGYETGALSAAWDLAYSIGYMEALGGTWDWLRMDNPLQRVIENAGGTLAEAVDEVVAYMEAIHASRPDIAIGFVVTPTSWEYDGSVRYPAVAYGYDLKTGLDALIADVATAGEELAFVHLDVDWAYQNGMVESANADAVDWWERVAAIQATCQAAAIPFGVSLASSFGGGSSAGWFPGAPYIGSDERFQRDVLRMADQVRLLNDNGLLDPLDHVLVQSFYYYPRDMAPNTTPYTFADTFLKARAILRDDLIAP